MPDAKMPATTQRAYTLRLRGLDQEDHSWREVLWQTHEAVNQGAKVFGDWLLTLRGGLDHKLADAKVAVGKGTSKSEQDPTPEERKARRILLALSWLSVESRRGAPEAYIVASGSDCLETRNGNVLEALGGILKARGVARQEADGWMRDCSASLSAAIREDAVWVNRSRAFDEAVDKMDGPPSRAEVWDMLEPFFGSAEPYLAPAKGSGAENAEAAPEEKAKDLVQKAGQWLSSRFGEGEGADFERFAGVYETISEWAGERAAGITGNAAMQDLARALDCFDPAPKQLDGVLRLISGPGYKSATRNFLKEIGSKAAVTQEDLDKLRSSAIEDAARSRAKTGSKGQRPYADAILADAQSACGFTYLKEGERARHSEYAVILDHAARRVSLAHTWVKRAEAERRTFEEEAQRMANVPDSAKSWLDSFCAERTDVSGALEPYRIRRRAIGGWKLVVDAWGRKSCTSAADRIAAARLLQDDPEIDKFGDIQLFEALAEDDALGVWHKDGDPKKAADPELLTDYMLATEAEFKRRQFKVPAYRHPDALLHPVFCDFGKSRWGVRFEIHEDRQTSRPRALQMDLRAGTEIRTVKLGWQSKRLAEDLALRQEAPQDGASELSRADRLGRAASGAAERDMVKIAGLFEQEDWNGRLQAARHQLEAIAKIRDSSVLPDHERRRLIAKMLNRLRWLVTFSAKLQPMGPWCEFAKRAEGAALNTDPQRWPHSDANKSRQAHARLMLSRLPGLRVLSVDLGHRYAAACAVWEAQSTKQAAEACERAGRLAPQESDLYLYLRERNARNADAPTQDKKTVIYRRIGADTLPDGKPHPAPWARLERQFLIKLQGEEQAARAASSAEIWAVHQMEAQLGRAAPLIDCLVKGGWGQTEKQKSRLEDLRRLGWKAVAGAWGSSGTEQDVSDVRKPALAVDELMASAVRTLRLGLQRHGDRARIAHYLVSSEKTRPGGIKEKLDESGRIEILLDAFAIWHGLRTSHSWRDEAARQLWEEHIATLPGYEAPAETADGVSRQERKKREVENRNRLHRAAETLSRDEKLRMALHAAWKQRWETDDEQWKLRLRWFKDWVLPRGAHANHGAIRKTGGLSLNRLATLTEFRRKVQIAFFTRLRPDGTTCTTREEFGQRALDSLEHLREQRVKQLASRIAEAALGIGRVKQSEDGRDRKRPEARVDEACHAVVIENLTHYRPEETRTRRENRQLMNWASSKVRKYLSEACQLHGLHLREVMASYTSRQDSRTGAPGMRCQDVPVKEFMQSPFWRKRVAQAEARGRGDAVEGYLVEMNAQWKGKTAQDWGKAGAVRVPVPGGEIFVSADQQSPAAKGLQADLNAAANIGLRALLDPDWPGKWWYVPCDADSFKPAKDKVSGSGAVGADKALQQSTVQPGDTGSKDKKKGVKGDAAKGKQIVNLWRDISAFPLTSCEPGEWRDYASYRNRVQALVVEVLRGQATRAGAPPQEPEGEDALPF